MTDPFRTRDHVPDFDSVAADYARLSEETRLRHRSRCDIFYGDHPDERLDLFFPPDIGPGLAPIHIFLHGGYWRANRKEDYAFVAEPVIASGAIAAIVEYSLMPKVRMAQLVDQVRRAASWLAKNAVEFGGDPASITASGHSAGAHLAFYLVARGPHEPTLPDRAVSRLMLISGLYDLEPLGHSFLQAEIALTKDEIAQWTPLTARVRAGVEMAALVGGAETLPFHQQAGALAARYGLHVTTLPSLNHMSIMRSVGQSEEPAWRALRQFLVVG